MRTATISTLAALLALSAAQSLSEVPKCAQTCFTDGVTSSGCGLLDTYCQCTTGVEKFRQTTISCLCKSDCTATDLMKVQQISNGICSSALAASSQTYSATTVGLEVCQATAGSSGGSGSGTGTAASTEASATGNSDSQASSSVDAQSDNAAAPAVTGVVGFSGAVMGAVGLGLMAL